MIIFIMPSKWSVRRTTVLMMLCAAFLAGLAGAKTGTSFSGGWLILASVLVIFSLKSRPARLVSVCTLVLLLGWARGSAYTDKLATYDTLWGQRVVAVVQAESDGIYDDRAQLAFDAGSIHLIKPYETNLVGRIGVKGFGEKAVYRGDQVQVEGKLYKTRGSKQSGLSFAELKVVGRSTSIVENIRRRFVAGTESALPEPHASFGLGLVIGQRSTLPKVTTDQLTAVGLTHIIAVSGYNLTILTRAAGKAFGKRSKYQSALLSILLMTTFLLLTGFSASIVRAAIVSGLSLVAWYYGRRVKPLLLLLFVAALTAGWYPLYLWSDIGWYLSFLAFYGVLVLAPLISRRVFRKRPGLLGGVALESFAAQIMTAPLILFIFKQASLVALVANPLIGPLIPVAMLFSAIAGLGGMLLTPFAGWFAWPARLLLTYILDIVNMLSRIPSALVNRNLGLGQMLLLYSTIVLICIVLWHSSKQKQNDIIKSTKVIIESS